MGTAEPGNGHGEGRHGKGWCGLAVWLHLVLYGRRGTSGRALLFGRRDGESTGSPFQLQLSLEAYPRQGSWSTGALGTPKTGSHDQWVMAGSAGIC